jgi:hypothetical protein
VTPPPPPPQPTPQVRKHFTPEFINRIDEFIIFEPLVKSHIREVRTRRLPSGPAASPPAGGGSSGALVMRGGAWQQGAAAARHPQPPARTYPASLPRCIPSPAFPRPAQIVRLRLRGVEARLADKKMRLVVEQSALEWLAGAGYGASPACCPVPARRPPLPPARLPSRPRPWHLQRGAWRAPRH